MTKNQKLEALKNWQHSINKFDDDFFPMIDFIGLSSDGLLVQIVYELQNQLTEMTGLVVGDKEKWLEWYWKENNMGEEAKEAGYNGNLKKISTINDLLELVEQDQSTDTKS